MINKSEANIHRSINTNALPEYTLISTYLANLPDNQ